MPVKQGTPYKFVKKDNQKGHSVLTRKHNVGTLKETQDDHPMRPNPGENVRRDTRNPAGNPPKKGNKLKPR